ncbi:MULTISPECIES: hypothetical protein [unclassified Sphingomonas]|uniref:hypothetical protein n=1 Tax=unclassified Sphingomonas TaxID=196159 RepID=UPI0006F1D2C0|nr:MULTISPECIES: hypothetical protein [unclassified Sphingomonas]KQX19397.1 hypothetical protein ASD17_12730 [Sphingomonas sp. Root1294]KQY65599.1 hypothetical protein ASD39_15930 [Sphingomonas sp. Root50]KRB95099.1 hypothetical protein ASE22_04125 [Sphingomonas sp. Root720]
MTTFSKSGASGLWLLLFTVASSVTSLLLACATPFPSLAALAAVHMDRRAGIALMLLAWVAAQAVGFCVLGYPFAASSLGWAAGLGTAAVASLIGARLLLPRFAGAPVWARLAIAYVAGFLVFKLVVFAWALGLGGAHAAADPAVMGRQFVRNAVILAGLSALHRGLLALGVPPARDRAVAARC